MSLTPRECILLALDHKKPDLVPIHDSPWETTMRRWRNDNAVNWEQDLQLHGLFRRKKLLREF